MIKVSIIIPVWNQQDLIIRALDSIPRRRDIEVLVRDDGSIDNTLAHVLDYAAAHRDLDIKTFANAANMGVGYTKNRLYDDFKGEYVHQLDSDDYLYTEEYSKAIDQLTGEDIVYINLVANDGFTIRLTEETKHGYCAGTARFYKRTFLADHRCPEIRAGEDWHLNEALLAIPHTEKFTDINAYHYTFPREGSLFDLLKKGQLKP